MAYIPETVMNCDDDYVNKPEKYKCLWNTIDGNIFNKHNDQEKKTLVKSHKVRRLRTMAIEVYKILHQESPSYLHDLIKIKDTKYCFRYHNITEIPSVRTARYGLKSFRYAAAKLWNELPNHFRTQTSFNQFKNLINSWNGNSCRCNACC